jgi:ribose 5-phosphate isomerase B
MKIAIGSDHGGLELKEAISSHLLASGHDVLDVGTHDRESTDYPDYAGQVAIRVVQGEVDRGILVCGTGQGMAMSVNKVAGVRAAVVSDVFSAEMAMEHNDARVLCLGQRVVGPGLALRCVNAWLGATFGGGRHARRVGKIEALQGALPDDDG